MNTEYSIVYGLANQKVVIGNWCRVRFPGAVNSKFTTDMAFITPADLPHIPTYRVMDSDGELLDKSRERPVDASDEEILTWYKNMMSGMLQT